MQEFLSNLSGRQRLVAFIFVVALSTTLLAFLAGGWPTAIMIGLLILCMLWLTRPLWTPPESDTNRIGLSSLTVISGVALAVLGRTPASKPWLNRILPQLGLSHESAQQISSSDRVLSALVLSFVLAGVFVVNWLKDNSAMRKHPTPIDKDFPELSYRHKLLKFADVLRNRLTVLDEETKWDDYFFTPLEAEVEVEVVSGRRQKRKTIVNLILPIHDTATL